MCQWVVAGITERGFLAEGRSRSGRRWREECGGVGRGRETGAGEGRGAREAWCRKLETDRIGDEGDSDENLGNSQGTVECAVLHEPHLDMIRVLVQPPRQGSLA